MTNKEAKEQLEIAMEIVKQQKKDYFDERDIPVLMNAIEALEKQISKEPIKIKFFIDIEYKELQEERFPEALGCPNCGKPITVPGLSRPKDFLYCEYCGQRLKMEENK